MRPRSRQLLPLAAAAIAAMGHELGAQIVFDGEPAEPLALSISGAVSMGAYQGGVNWALLELFRQAGRDEAFRVESRIPRYRLAAVTGASAGNINTLLWAIEACSDRRPMQGVDRWMPPDSSLFWQVWVGVGLADMLRPKDAERDDLGLLDLGDVRRITDPLVLARLSSPALHGGCHVPLGITLTRIRPDTLRLNTLAVATQRVATIFRASVAEGNPGAGEDRMRFLHVDSTAHRDRSFGKLVELLPVPGPIARHQILDAVQASSAYPVAFEPVKLRVRDPHTNVRGEEYFIDGGVFDNNPLTLLLALHRRDGDALAPPVQVLYLNPGQFRGALAHLRRQAPDAVPPGGLAALFALLDGAVGTARQYELQLVVRERESEILRDSLYRRLAMREETLLRIDSAATLQPDLRRLVREFLGDPDAQARQRGAAPSLRDPLPGGLTRREANRRSSNEPYRLAVGSRAHPLFGEHLNSFAGFLGRPLREYDFWVGAYDALHLAIDAHVCRDESEECRRLAIAALLRRTDMIPEPGRTLLAVLHDAEYSAGEPRLLASLPLISLDPAVERQRIVLLALARALLPTMRPPALPPHCPASTPLGRYLCADGLAPVLAAFREVGSHSSNGDGAPRPMEILEAWAADSSCIERRPLDCRAEPDFVELVEHPERVIDRHLGEMLVRLMDVEERMQAAAQPSYTRPTQALAWFYYNSEIGREPRTRFFESSIPEGSGNWLRYVPQSVGAQIGTSGYEVRYRIVVPLGRSLAPRLLVSIPLITHWNPGPKTDPRLDWYAGAGAGLGLRMPLPASLVLREIGVHKQVFASVEQSHVRDWFRRNGVAETEIYANVVAGSVRVALRLPHSHARGRVYGDHGWAVSVGINDVGGMLYWATR